MLRGSTTAAPPGRPAGSSPPWRARRPRPRRARGRPPPTPRPATPRPRTRPRTSPPRRHGARRSRRRGSPAGHAAPVHHPARHEQPARHEHLAVESGPDGRPDLTGVPAGRGVRGLTAVAWEPALRGGATRYDRIGGRFFWLRNPPQRCLEVRESAGVRGVAPAGRRAGGRPRPPFSGPCRPRSRGRGGGRRVRLPAAVDRRAGPGTAGGCGT